MKILVITFCWLFLTSCGVYKYNYSMEKIQIYAIKKNNITIIMITDLQTKEVSKFEAIPGKRSNIFSLLDFSPNEFACKSEKTLTLSKGHEYYFDIFPKGDRAVGGIRIQIQADGKIVQIK